MTQDRVSAVSVMLRVPLDIIAQIQPGSCTKTVDVDNVWACLSPFG